VWGIAGSVALHEDAAPPSLDGLSAMLGALRHRGPDERGMYRDRHAGLACARLAIVDVENGHQPIADGRGSVWAVFNGEIFNHAELRRELESLGHRFRTRCDTEVLVHGWQRWGARAFARFNGQFACAIWDAGCRSLTLARDRYGVCPLFLCQHGGRLFFASEIKALFAADPTIPRALDSVGLAETFTFWATVAPQTGFAGVTQLEPGHVRVIRDGHAHDEAFWEPSYETRSAEGSPADLDDAARGVRGALEEAVRLRMVSADVPVAAYLSGGLDSSLVASLARSHARDRFETFSVRFEDPEYDEGRYQAAMAAALGSRHHVVTVRDRDIAAALPDVVEHAEQPVLRTAPAPLLILSRLVHESGIKVVLTGEGADEVFGGYDLFREAKVRRFWGRQPDSRIRPLLLARLYPYMARSPVARQEIAQAWFGQDRQRWREPGFGHRPRWQATAALHRLFSREVRDALVGTDVVDRLLGSLPDGFGGWSALSQDEYLEVRTLLSGYLLSAQGDRMLMANSVEGRYPYLDPELTKLADRLPATMKLRGLHEKVVLRRVATGLLPEPIVARLKQPYRAPDARVFAGAGAPDWVGDILSERSVLDGGIFDPGAVTSLWRTCRARPVGTPFSNTDNMALVGVLSTGLLLDRLVRRPPQSAGGARVRTLIDRVVA
jgi:asparagine synthase (glutamine-hydrolysing)